jgi:hypothetical protein
MFSNSKKIVCFVLMFALAGCTQAQILTDLDVAAAALAAVSTVPGIPPIYATYIADTATALDCVSAAVEAGGTNTQVGLAIAACGLSAAAPVTPTGTPSTVVAAITAVVAAVQKVLADEQTVTTALNSNTDLKVNGAFVTSFGPHGKDKFSLGAGGKAKVAKIRKTLAGVKAKFPKGSK